MRLPMSPTAEGLGESLHPWENWLYEPTHHFYWSWWAGVSRIEVPPDRDAALASYDEAVNAISLSALAVERWDAQTPCEEWTAVDLVGHLLAIIRYYHRLLDAAEAGQPLADLPVGVELATMNAEDLRSLPEKDGSQRAERFKDSADDHFRRLQEVDWGLPIGVWQAVGEQNVGQHVSVAIGEWHVHAWDLGRAIGQEYRPSDVLTVSQGHESVFGTIASGDPWLAVLLAYDRDPNWPARLKTGGQ